MKAKVLMLLLSFVYLLAMADEPKTQLVILSKDGSKVVYPLDYNPRVTFSDADLIVKANGLETVYSLENVSQFTYESSPDNKCMVVLNGPMATFCSAVNLDFSAIDNVKAYIASSFDSATGTLVMTPITDVTAGTGVLLIGQKGTYEIPFSNSSTTYDNLLKGVTIATEISPTEEGYTNYILVNGSHGTGFYRLSASGLLDAGKAYLHLPNTIANSRGVININYDGNTTGITELEAEEAGNGYIRLDGVHIMNPSRKGIYMKDGKKVIIK